MYVNPWDMGSQAVFAIYYHHHRRLQLHHLLHRRLQLHQLRLQIQLHHPIQLQQQPVDQKKSPSFQIDPKEDPFQGGRCTISFDDL